MSKNSGEKRIKIAIVSLGCAKNQVDAEQILALLDSYDGVLPFNDKVDPEIIRRETGMSKNEFKRAVGHLLKNGQICIDGKVIRKTVKE